MKYTILFVIFFIVIFVIIKIKIKSGSSVSDNSETESASSQYLQYFNSINQMSYEELDKIHEDLLPLCEEVNFVILPHADEYGNPIWDSKEEFIRKLNEKKSETLPKEKQIYGCKTFGDAEKLNQAIVKRLDELDEK